MSAILSVVSEMAAATPSTIVIMSEKLEHPFATWLNTVTLILSLFIRVVELYVLLVERAFNTTPKSVVNS